MRAASQISCDGEHNWPRALSSCWAVQQHACVKAVLPMDSSPPVMEDTSDTGSGIFPGDDGLWWLGLAPELPDGFVETSLRYTAVRTRLPSLPPLLPAWGHTALWADGSSRLAGTFRMLSYGHFPNQNPCMFTHAWCLLLGEPGLTQERVSNFKKCSISEK